MLRAILKILGYLILFIVLIYLALVGTGNAHLITAVRATYLRGHTTASIDDYPYFDTRSIPARDPQSLWESQQYNASEIPAGLRKVLVETKTVAFLVIKNDSVLLEEYWDHYSDTSHSNSFSMAKSITTILTQIAIQEDYIHSWEDLVKDYLPDLKGPYSDSLRLKHLSAMAAGLRWDEAYSAPFSITTKAYFGNDIRALMINEVPVVEAPGHEFQYQSGATELLGLVLRKAVGKDMTTWAANTLWKDVHAMEDAFWYLDRENGVELAYCCYASNARDFSRLGSLMLNQGRYRGEQILDSTFVERATQPMYSPNYGMGFWIDPSFDEKVYYFRGILGQYIIVLPQRNMVVVRLGKERKPNVDSHPEDFMEIVRGMQEFDKN
ncbi:MAG: beta-lactamase family protein [Bacteroidota bacterium]|nr:beta-lactamase family protein [Bacteroidota bacterium]MDX5448697.1 beta-lactamase family protein [Bacteroidota bacterium]MDX5506011.1 beta-lactamase family protein [Bacteroidota bacterium]